MAQKKAQYTSAMDSVYDFIFTEAKKPPSKVKPVKVTGLDSNDPYVDIATAVLEQPLMYVNKTTEDAIKDIGNIPIQSFAVDKEGGEVRFSTGNVKDVLNNDLSFVDKGFAKLEAARKAGRMAAWGKEIAAFTASGMARALDLDKETQDILLDVGKAEWGTSDKRSPEKGLSTAMDLRFRGTTLAKRFAENDLLKDFTEDDLKMKYGETKGVEIYRKLQSIGSKYAAEMSKEESQRDFSDVFTEAADREMHIFLEQNQLGRKASEYRKEASKLDPESDKAKKLNRQAKGYEDTGKVLEVLDADDRYKKQGSVDKYIITKEAELKKLQEELKNLSNKNDDVSRHRVKEIGEDIKGIGVQVRNFKIQKSAYNLGVIETQISSIKQIYEYTVGGALIPAIINGDFYNADKNAVQWLQPRDFQAKATIFTAVDKNGKVITWQGAGFTAKRGDYKFQQAYYEGMMDIYYRFTPKGIIENLTTGNGFARQALKEKNNFIAQFKNSEVGKFFGEGDIKWDELFGANKEDYLKTLEGTLGAEKYQKLMAYFEDNKVLSKFSKLVLNADRFNYNKHIKKKIQGFLEKSFGGTLGRFAPAIKDKIQGLLLKMAKDEAAKGFIKDIFADQAGLKAITVGLKTAIKSALAAYTGGVSQAFGMVIDFAVDMAVQVAIKIAKPVVKALITGFVFAIVGLIGVGYLIFSSPFKVMKTLGTYSHVAPNEIVLGDTDYEVPQGGNGDPGQPGEWAGGAPLPDGVSCLFGANDTKYYCSQGPYGSFSHGNLNAIDIAYNGIFYAPAFCGKGNCVIEYYGDFSSTSIGAGNAITLTASYGGNTYKFIMYHITLSSALSMGSQVSAGQAVGQILINGVESGCWTGPHLHLEIDYNGTRVNPYDVMGADPSSGGFGCSMTVCGSRE